MQVGGRNILLSLGKVFNKSGGYQAPNRFEKVKLHISIGTAKNGKILNGTLQRQIGMAVTKTLECFFDKADSTLLFLYSLT